MISTCETAFGASSIKQHEHPRQEQEVPSPMAIIKPDLMYEALLYCKYGPIDDTDAACIIRTTRQQQPVLS
ncbi:hypothetical protein J1N35_042540 [Gossypium stocksii]|uniref:Uncharacterized protein n=1 Tax=Gossypium stocksii TaxID=47602 RepID=A0A9D3ZEB6_9ROSI|nr:hypothetical protein J1N35_042540 [Gossypium stocksii]